MTAILVYAYRAFLRALPEPFIHAPIPPLYTFPGYALVSLYWLHVCFAHPRTRAYCKVLSISLYGPGQSTKQDATPRPDDSPVHFVVARVTPPITGRPSQKDPIYVAAERVPGHVVPWPPGHTQSAPDPFHDVARTLDDSMRDVLVADRGATCIATLTPTRPIPVVEWLRVLNVAGKRAFKCDDDRGDAWYAAVTFDVATRLFPGTTLHADGSSTHISHNPRDKEKLMRGLQQSLPGAVQVLGAYLQNVQDNPSPVPEQRQPPPTRR